MQCHPALWQEVGFCVPSLCCMEVALYPPLSQHALWCPCKRWSPPPTVRQFGPPGASEDRVKGPLQLSATSLHDCCFLKAVNGVWQVALFSEEVPVVPLHPLQHKQLKRECEYLNATEYSNHLTLKTNDDPTKCKPHRMACRCRILWQPCSLRVPLHHHSSSSILHRGNHKCRYHYVTFSLSHIVVRMNLV